jgi:hypothetical protein
VTGLDTTAIVCEDGREMVTCPYCPHALPDRPGAVTCGDKACQRKHQGQLSRDWYWANRERVLTEKKKLYACQFCGAKIHAGQTCHRLECKRAYHTQWRQQGRDAPKDARPVKVDLSTAQIDSKLAALAAQRKATRSWLRIDDPWAQRPGCALHQRVDVSTYDLEGALR